MRRDLALVMPSRDVSRMVAVLAAQRSRVDLTNWGAEAAAEKDLLLERFAAWAGRVLARPPRATELVAGERSAMPAPASTRPAA